MWPQFWQNQLYEVARCFFFVGLIFSQSVFSEDTDPYGLITNLESLREISGERLSKLLDQIQRNPKRIEDFSKIKDIGLDPYYLEALLFHSDRKYIVLSQKNECNLYSMLERDMLKTGQSQAIPSIPVRVQLVDGTQESALLSKNDFFELVYKLKCFANKDMQKLFALERLQQTLKGITLPLPESENQCPAIIDEWQRNPYTPYICEIGQTLIDAEKAQQALRQVKKDQLQSVRFLRNIINRAEAYKKKLTPFQYEYLKNICQNLNRSDTFCEKYLAKNFWNKVLTGQAPLRHLKFRCQEILKKKKLTKTDYRICANKLVEDRGTCQFAQDPQYTSLFPQPSCSEISQALKFSRLETNYRDCPGRIANEAIVNTFRLLAHFKKLDINEDSQYCSTQSVHYFTKINLEADNEEAWGVGLCYEDFIKEKEVCLPSMLGHFPDSPLSIQSVTEKILGRIQSNFSDSKCEWVTKKEYNPVFLKYKQGCFLVFEPSLCYSTFCPFELYFNQKKLSQISVKGFSTIDYFSESFSRDQYSLKSVLEREKLFKSKNLKNLTEVRFFFKQRPRGIIHGTGCAEDILPQFFKGQVFNFCRPMHFIIDGVFEHKFTTFMVLRSPLDDIHSPRIISWRSIYAAVKAYSLRHPLNTWTLNGIY